MVEVGVKLRIILSVTFKVKFMFELAICLIEQCYRHCSEYIFEKVNFILSVSCNNENVTLQFPLTKGNLN